MLVKTDFIYLVPHAGDMCLLDGVLAFDASSIHAVSTSHVLASHHLRGPHGLHSVHLAEYGAQAMAVHGGLLGRARGGAVKAGVLVALRGVTLHVDRIDDLAGDLVGVAELLMDSDSSQQYGFRILHGDDVIAEGRAAVMLGETE